MCGEGENCSQTIEDRRPIGLGEGTFKNAEAENNNNVVYTTGEKSRLKGIKNTIVRGTR